MSSFLLNKNLFLSTMCYSYRKSDKITTREFKLPNKSNDFQYISWQIIKNLSISVNRATLLNLGYNLLL